MKGVAGPMHPSLQHIVQYSKVYSDYTLQLQLSFDSFVFLSDATRENYSTENKSSREQGKEETKQKTGERIFLGNRLQLA